MPRDSRDPEQQPLLNQQTTTRSENHKTIWYLGTALAAFFGVLVGVYLQPDHTLPTSGITVEAYEQGLALCAAIESERSVTTSPRSVNPRYGLNKEYTRPLLIQNANLVNGDGSVRPNVDIFVKDGLIVSVEPANSARSFDDLEIVDVNGRYVTPGLVDMHSHSGTDSWPGLDATSDTNEMTSPLTPFARSIDSYNPDDWAIDIINSGGVTTSLILPGSGNLIGGTAYPVKHRKTNRNLVSDMLVYAGDYPKGQTEKQWKYMKMACGENIKNSYGRSHFGAMPESRMGEGYLFRQAFQSASQLLQAQDDWCMNAINARSRKRNSEITTRFPQDTARDSLVELLRGNVLLQNHCYETYDIEMMVRHSHEFGFNITAFHHALEAWKVAASEGIGAAIFADHWGYKKEAYGTSVRAAQVLTKAGARVAFKSDHPVLNAQVAAKGHHYGLDRTLAIRAVTLTPAELLGLSHRIGFVAPGYDADLVVWNTFPLDIGAHPLKVYTDGYLTFSHPLAESSFETKFKHELPDQSENETRERKSHSVNTYAVVNISKIYADEATTLEKENLSIVVVNGLISCIGSCNPSEMKVKFNAKNGIVTPGLVATYGRLGLEEIPSEKMTCDGRSSGFDLESGGTRGVDGLRVWNGGSLQLQAAFSAGITTAISLPRAVGVLQGHSVAFRTSSENVNDAVLKEVTGITFVMGNDAKDSTLAASYSGQLKIIRKLLMSNVKGVIDHLSGNASVTPEWEKSPFFSVVLGDLVLFVEAQEANDITRIIKVKNQVEEALAKGLLNLKIAPPKIKMTIVGGAEAWVVCPSLTKVANQLVINDVALILRPPRCTPGSWATRQCKVPSSYPSAADILIKAGVKVSFANVEDNFIRGLVWEAGWVHADSDGTVTKSDAVGTVTWNAADASGVGEELGRLQLGRTAQFVVFSGDPLSFGSLVSLVVDQNRVVESPSQL